MSGWPRVGFAIACALLADVLVFVSVGIWISLATGHVVPLLGLPLAAAALLYIVPQLAIFSPAVVFVHRYDTYRLILVSMYGAAIGPILMLVVLLQNHQLQRWPELLLHLGLFWYGVCISVLFAVFYALGMRRWNWERIQPLRHER